MKKVETKTLDELANFFKMYSDTTRLKILYYLFQKELCVQELVDKCDMSQSSISHQLSKLRDARIVKTRKDGKQVFYSLDDEHIQMIFNNGLSHILEED